MEIFGRIDDLLINPTTGERCNSKTKSSTLKQNSRHQQALFTHLFHRRKQSANFASNKLRSFVKEYRRTELIEKLPRKVVTTIERSL